MQLQESVSISIINDKGLQKIYITPLGRSKKEIGFYSHLSDKLIFSDKIKVNDDLLMSIWYLIYEKSDVFK